MNDFSYEISGNGSLVPETIHIIHAGKGWDWQSLRLHLWTKSNLEDETQIRCIHQEDVGKSTLFIITIDYSHPIEKVFKRIWEIGVMADVRTAAFKMDVKRSMLESGADEDTVQRWYSWNQGRSAHIDGEEN